jgi:hypothetical protein
MITIEESVCYKNKNRQSIGGFAILPVSSPPILYPPAPKFPRFGNPLAARKPLVHRYLEGAKIFEKSCERVLVASRTR